MTSTDDPVLVLDATVLINFAHARRLDLLGKTSRVLCCPDVVWDQAIERPVKNYDVEGELIQLEQDGVLVRKRIEETEHFNIMKEFLKRLDPGESDALTLAVINGWPVATDDKLARDEADRHGLKCTGTLGILFTLIKWDVITEEEGSDYHDKMCEAGYRSPCADRTEFLEKYKKKVGQIHDVF